MGGYRVVELMEVVLSSTKAKPLLGMVNVGLIFVSFCDLRYTKTTVSYQCAVAAVALSHAPLEVTIFHVPCFSCEPGPLRSEAFHYRRPVPPIVAADALSVYFAPRVHARPQSADPPVASVLTHDRAALARIST